MLPSLPKAGLARYFEQKYKQGGDFEDEEYERDVKDWCWVHKPSGIKAPFLLAVRLHIIFLAATAP